MTKTHPSLLTNPAYSSKLFETHKKDDGSITMSSEMSMLHHASPKEPVLRRIYNDACDIGLAIQSHRTGVIHVFVRASLTINADAKIESWIFKPVTANCPVEQVIVFND